MPISSPYSSTKTIAAVATAASALLITCAVCVGIAIVNDINAFYNSVKSDYDEFTHYAESAHSEMRVESTRATLFGPSSSRIRRGVDHSGSQCACSIHGPNRCPAGPPGPPGTPGRKGLAGHRGERGQRGMPGMDIMAIIHSERCISCPEGAPGLPGRPGPPGLPGPDGDAGKGGLPGRNGDDGQPGENGDRGRPGGDGLRGPPGQAGDNGERGVGVPGSEGEPGPRGHEGRQGPPGIDGHPGRDGGNGPAGPAGKDGDKGQPGDPGPEGGRGVPGPDANYCPCAARSGNLEGYAPPEVGDDLRLAAVQRNEYPSGHDQEVGGRGRGAAPGTPPVAKHSPYAS